jgi:hypothetical protein
MYTVLKESIPASAQYETTPGSFMVAFNNFAVTQIGFKLKFKSSYGDVNFGAADCLTYM